MTMNDKETVMKLEYLPNEILMQCFCYLNTFELFYSFNSLNNRLDTLLHSLPLLINFDNVNKLMFDQFCQINGQISNQIDSIKLSNIDQCFQAKLLFSYFPYQSYSFLRQFQIIWPNYRQIRGKTFNSMYRLDIELSHFPSLKLQTLTIPYLCESIFDIDPISSLLNLTIDYAETQDFSRLFKQFPQLKYLRMNHVHHIYVSTDQCNLHLETLIVHQFDGKFNHLELCVKQMPNLKRLATSNSSYSNEIINATRWEHIITSSLPYLNKFQFKFHLYCYRHQSGTFISRVKSFQTDFWLNKHWHTEYVLQEKSLLFYTIPYSLKKYSLQLNQNRYSNGTNRFAHVTHLSISLQLSNENHQYYFPNVTSLSLSMVSYGSDLTMEYIQYIKQILNLSQIKHLEMVSSLRINDPSILFELVKQTSQLSSLIINKNQFHLSLQNEELCKYFNQYIRRLHITFWANLPFDRFCQIFSNLENLTCSMDDDDEDILIFLIEHLPKLSTLKASCRCKQNPDIRFFRLKTEIEKYNIAYEIQKTFIDADTDADTDEADARNYYAVSIFLWIGNKISHH